MMVAAEVSKHTFHHFLRCLLDLRRESQPRLKGLPFNAIDDQA
jgi:hypothetical protein